MSFLRFASLVSAAVVAMAQAGSAVAMAPIAMPADNRLVVFNYDSNDTYTILTVPGVVTDIELSPNETVQAFALGDSVRWIVAKTQGHIFVKPTVPNIFTSATLVTSLRTYQITLRSGPPNGKWYQRVSWSYPDVILMEQQTAADARRQQETRNKKLQAEVESLRAANLISTPAPGKPVENLNFDYEVKGEAPFKPLQVYDDGTFTWIRLPANMQEMPALFVMMKDGKYGLVNFTVADRSLKVQGLFKQAVLRLGEQEVVIRGQGANANASTNVFGKLFGYVD